jgi:membrane-associated protein
MICLFDMSFFSLTLGAIPGLLMQYRYFFLFPIAVIEGPIISVITGYLVHLGFFDLFVAYFVILSGDLVGDVLYYLVGRYGRLQFIEKWGHFVGVNADKVKDMERIFGRHSAKALFFGKFTLGLGGIIILAAGASRVRFSKFFLYSSLGSIPKSAILMLIGGLFGYAFLTIGRYFNYTAIITMVVAFFIALGYYLFQRYAKKSLEK